MHFFLVGDVAQSGELDDSSSGHTYALNGTNFVGYYAGKEAWVLRLNGKRSL